MSTISEKLTQLNTIKGDIKTAINNKGGEVGNDFSTYATAINNLSTGSGGSGETYENPEFYEVRTQKGTNYDNLFRGYNGPDIDVSQWDTSKVTRAHYCFNECKKSMDISNWDLSSLSDAQYMFYSFNNGNKYMDLSVLDFSNATKADYMFYDSNTDYLDVRNINLAGVTSYNYLFSNCSGTELDLSNWDISKVTHLGDTFYSSNFKKINLTGWNTVNIKYMSYAFSYMSHLETLIIPDWDMTNTTSTSSFLSGTSNLKYIDLSRSNDFTINKIASFLPTKTATTYGEILIPANTSQDAIDALIAKYWKPIGPKLDLTSTKLVLELDEIKPGKTTKVCTGNSDPWYGDDRPETIEFISSDESIATINGREIIGVAEGTVTIECRRREDNVIISTAPVTLVVSETDSKPNLVKFRTTGSESSSSTLITVNGTSVKTNMCTKDPITGIYSYDPGVQITSIKFYYTSSSYSNVNEIIKFNFNATNIIDMSSMFGYYPGTELDLSDYDVSNVTNMQLTISNCKNLVSVDISGWDTSNVTIIDMMFNSCSNLVNIIGEIDLSNLNESICMGSNGYGNPFYQCYSLETLYLKNIYKNCTMSNDSKWSINLRDTKVKNECLLYIINELPDLYAKGLTTTDQIKLTLPPTNTLTAEQVQPAIDKGWTVVNCNFN